MAQKNASYTLLEIAEITSSKMVGDPNYRISGVNNLECATKEDVSFIANPLYLRILKKSQAGVVFSSHELPDEYRSNFLINASPSKAFQKVVELFHDSEKIQSGFVGIHPTAVIHPSSKIGENVTIGPNSTIDREVVIGNNTVIAANVSISSCVKIGSNCHLYPQVSIREGSILHNDVILQSGVVIGSCGFGYITDHKGKHHKLEHVGKVVLEDHVEIGANTSIDRARFKETRIKAGTKIDNLVQIGHGVEVGENSLIISQSGIAGSTTLGKHNVLAGQVGVVGHISLPDQTVIAARGAVTKTITKPGRYGGAPAIPEEKFYTQQMHFRKLDSYVTRIKELEEKLKELELQLKS